MLADSVHECVDDNFCFALQCCCYIYCGLYCCAYWRIFLPFVPDSLTPSFVFHTYTRTLPVTLLTTHVVYCTIRPSQCLSRYHSALFTLGSITPRPRHPNTLSYPPIRQGTTANSQLLPLIHPYSLFVFRYMFACISIPPHPLIP